MTGLILAAQRKEGGGGIHFHHGEFLALVMLPYGRRKERVEKMTIICFKFGLVVTQVTSGEKCQMLGRHFRTQYVEGDKQLRVTQKER